MTTAQLTPYLYFDGQCREAMNFYQSILGGALEMSSFGEAPEKDQTNIDQERIMHAHLKNEGLMLMASDILPDSKQVIGNNVHVSLVGNNESELRAIFLGLSENSGKVDLPLEKQFWGDTFGMLTDKYGIHWMININSQTA